MLADRPIEIHEQRLRAGKLHRASLSRSVHVYLSIGVPSRLRESDATVPGPLADSEGVWHLRRRWPTGWWDSGVDRGARRHHGVKGARVDARPVPGAGIAK